MTNNPTFRGRFITLEGGEGVGKSTQAIELRKYIENRGIDVILTREPGGSAGAEEIRKLLVTGGVDKWQGMTEILLHNAARVEHLHATVLPALKEGKWVVCDRYADSTLAYQGYGQGQNMESILQIHRIVTGDFWPELTLLLDGGTDLGLARAKSRDEEVDLGQREDRYERMGEKFHERLREAFLDIAKKNRERIEVVQVDGSIETVAARIRKIISKRFFGE